jgi:hypothetical protein
MNLTMGSVGWNRVLGLGVLAVSTAGISAQQKPPLQLPFEMPTLSTVDVRFRAYNANG